MTIEQPPEHSSGQARPSPRSLAKSLIFSIVAFSSVFTLLLTAFQLYQEFMTDKRAVDAQLRQVEVAYLESVVRILWTFDLEQLQVLLAGIHRLPDVHRVEVFHEGAALISLGGAELRRPVIREHPITYQSNGRTQNLGTLRVVASLDQVYGRLLDRVVVILASNAIKTFSVVLFVYFVFRFLVGRHLRRIRDHLFAGNTLEAVTPLRLDRAESQRPDELDEVVTALNARSERLHRLHASLASSERQFRDLVEGSLQGVMIQRDGKPLFVNQAFADMLGYGTTEAVLALGSLYPLVHSDDRHRIRKVHEAVLAGGAVSSPYQLRAIRKDGSSAVFESVARKIEWNGAAAVQHTVIDVTQRVKAEQDLLAYKDQLEELVSERTRALEAAQATLLRRERLAAIGELTGTVSHELRNPLGTISASFELLRGRVDTGGDEKIAQAFDRIERNIARCARIIDELLAYAQTRAAEHRVVDIDSWLERVLAEIDDVPGGELRLEMRNSATVVVDPDRLEQALINVVQNASLALVERADPAAPGVIRVSCVTRGQRVEIQVVDNGPGIRSDVLPHVFEPLFSTRTFGIGLGLPLVKRIMEEQDGGVEIDSEPGTGTTVTLWLPVESPETGESDPNPSGETRGEREPP